MIYRIPVILLPLLFVSPAPLFANSPALGATQRLRRTNWSTPRVEVRSGRRDFATRANGDYDWLFPKEAFPSYSCKAMAMNWLPLPLRSDRMERTRDRAIGPLHSWALLKQVIPYFYTNQTSASNGRKWSATFTRNNGKFNGGKN